MKQRWLALGLSLVAGIALGIFGLSAGGRIAQADESVRPASVAANDRFGICFVNSPEIHLATPQRIPERYRRALESGAKWTRWPLYWPNIERQNGVLDYSAHDAVVLEDLRQGLEINAILLNTPGFHATAGSLAVPMPLVNEKRWRPEEALHGMGREKEGEVSAYSTIPENLHRPIFSDGTDELGPRKTINEENYWARFVFQTVNRYRPGGELGLERGIRHWEIWNEPDRTYFWNGTVADYHRLLKVAYLAAHLADPEAKIILGGLAHWPTYEAERNWFPRLLDVMASDASPQAKQYGHYFDIAAWHWYSRPSDLYDKTLWARGQMAQRDIGGKEIWVNETNLPLWGEYPGPWVGGGYRGTPEEGAAFILQAYVWGFAASVERIFSFQLHDDCVREAGGHPEAFGLVRNFSDFLCWWEDPGLSQPTRNGTPRLSYSAYQLAADRFRDLSLNRHISHPEWEEFEFFDDTGQRVVVVWSKVGEVVTASLAAGSDHAILIGQSGITSTETIQPIDGRYVLSLPAATKQSPNDPPGIYLVGGQPYMLIEPAEHISPHSSMNPLLPFSPATFTVSWQGIDEGSGIGSYNIWYSDGPPAPGNDRVAWLYGTTDTSALFTGEVGHTYYFASRAKDRAGNQEPFPIHPQVSTTVRVAMVGAVRNNRDRPVPGGRVVITDSNRVSRSTTALADSSFRFIPLSKENYHAQAKAKGFGLWPPREGIDLRTQDMATVNFNLPPAQNLVRDGGFEGKLTEHWTLSGSTAAEVTTWPTLSGNRALILGSNFIPDRNPELKGGGNSTISQTITIPADMHKPTLSFSHKLATEEIIHRDGFEVLLMDETHTAHYLWGRLSFWQPTGWTHLWADLSAFKGQTVDLYFNLWQSSGERPSRVYVDEVSVGPLRRESFYLPIVINP